MAIIAEKKQGRSRLPDKDEDPLFRLRNLQPVLLRGHLTDIHPEGSFSDLFNEDVVEAFFWTDEKVTVYFEYELSPFNFELPILVPNTKGYYLGWRPWHYENGRKTRHATHVYKNNNRITGWSAEFFVPYKLLKPLTNVPPVKGTRWRANFYRMDYDNNNRVSDWSWQLTRTDFHDYERFGTLLFN